MSLPSPLAPTRLLLLALSMMSLPGCIDAAVGDLFGKDDGGGGGDGGDGGGGGGSGADFEGQQVEVVSLVGGSSSEELCSWVWDTEGSYSDACSDCEFTLELTYSYNRDASDLSSDGCSPAEDAEQTLGYMSDYPYNDTTYEVMMYEYEGTWYPVFLAEKSGDELSWAYYSYESLGDGYYYTYDLQSSGTLR